MKTETMICEADVRLSGTLILPEGDGPFPAVTLFPDIFGYGAHVLERAERIVGLGYAALAADLHGDRTELAVEPAMSELARFYDDPDRICRRGEAALAVLADHPQIDASRIAAIGFCFGGRLAFDLARRGAALKAAIGFHSSLVTTLPATSARIEARILACIGSEDPGVPAKERAAFEAEMRMAGADWQLHLYGGVYHTFTNWRADSWGRPDFARYDAGADRRSWAAMRLLLDEVIGTAAQAEVAAR